MAYKGDKTIAKYTSDRIIIDKTIPVISVEYQNTNIKNSIDGIDYYMIVDVALVDMCTDHKGVVALRQLHGKLAPDFVCQLRCDLAGLEGLPQMIGDHVVAAPPARELKILPLR